MKARLPESTLTRSIFQFLACLALAFCPPSFCAEFTPLQPKLLNVFDNRELDSSAQSVVFLIHGWNPPLPTNLFLPRSDKYTEEDEWFYLLNILRLKLTGSDWKIVPYHWERDAATGTVDFPGLGASQAAINAKAHGLSLGSQLGSAYFNLRRVHFIAHSAGSWCAREAARVLLEQNPYVVVQITLLDPFIPEAIAPATGEFATARISEIASWPQNDRLLRLENYYAEDGITLTSVPSAGTQERFSWRAGDVNQQVDWGGVAGVNLFYDYHSGPIEFYGDTVKASIVGETVPQKLLGPFDFSQLGWFRSLFDSQLSLPKITSQPVAETNVVVGGTAGLAVSAVRADAFQWFKNGQPYSATGSTLLFSPVSASDSGEYVLRITNAFGQTFSQKARLTVIQPSGLSPIVVIQPQSRAVVEGDTASFIVSAVGTDPLNYQWQRNEADIPGANSQSYTTPALLRANNDDRYRVLVSNSQGSATSGVATLMVNPAPPPGNADAFEPNESSLTATPLASGSSVSALISSSADVDWFKMAVTATGPINVSLVVPGGSDFDLELYGPAGGFIQGSYQGAGQAEAISYDATATGTYYARVFGFQGAFSSAKPYALNVSYATATTPSPTSYTLNGSAANGSVTKSPNLATYPANSTVTLTPVPASGYQFSSWSGSQGGSATPLVVTMDGNKTITANFSALPAGSGSIRVSIVPQGAADAGAQWRLTTESTWHNSGNILPVPAFGTYQVEFKGVTGWTIPANKAVPVTASIPDIWVNSDPFTQQPVLQVFVPYRDVAYANGTFVVVGNSSKVATSADAVNWTERETGFSAAFNGVSFVNNQFMAVGYGGGTTKVIASSDGINWTDRSPSSTIVPQDVAYGNGLYVVACESGRVLTSTDGATWTLRLTGVNDDLYDVAYANGLFVAVGSSLRILTSPDGMTWTSRNPALNGGLSFQAITYGNSQFVAVGWSGSIATSFDGLSWTFQNSGSGSVLRGVTYGNNAFVALGNSGTLVSSTDGVNWTSRNSGVGLDVFGIAFGGGKFVVAGNTGTIFSPGDAFEQLIALHPQSYALTTGESVTLNVFTTGPGPFGYQWLLNGAALANETNAALTFSALTLAQAGDYTVRVSSGSAVQVSQIGRLVVSPALPPSITAQPVSQTVVAGSTVSFSVLAISTAPLGYQWLLNQTNLLTGATNSVLTLTNAQPVSEGGYSVVVTNVAGSVTSSVASLTLLLLPPSIVQGPTNVSANALSTVALSVTASGVAPLIYQWQKDGASVAGGTNAVLTLAGISTNAAGSYQVIVTNVAGSVTSGVATVTVSRLVPTLTWATPAGIGFGTPLNALQLSAASSVTGNFDYSPAAGTVLGAGSRTLNVSFTPGDPTNYTGASASVTLSVNPAPLMIAASNQARLVGQPNPPLTVGYSGFVNGDSTNVLASQPMVTTTATVTSPPGSYPITVSGASAPNYNITHLAGTLSVTSNVPTIITHPASITRTQGQAAVFNVSATGAAPLSFQWLFNTTNQIGGATGTSFTITNAQPTHAGGYSVVVADADGSVTSSVATLTVTLTNVPPVISQQPTNQTASPGSIVAFSVVASGTPAPLFQWRKNAVNIPGANGPSYTLPSITISDAGSYDVVVSNAAGSVTSQGAVLGVTIGGSALFPLPIPTRPATFPLTARLGQGSVVAWGFNGTGQTNVPSNLNGVVAVSGGNHHSLALKSDGGVVAWGRNNLGQSNVPVSAQSGVVAVAAGLNHGLALKVDGTVIGWGDNGSGQSTVPAGLNEVVAVAGGEYHSIALKSDGVAVAWGINQSGITNVPSGLTGVVAIGAGSFHSLALRNDGTVVAWGENQYGQTSVPSDLSGVVAVSCGQFHNLALKSDGTVVAWGNNTYKQRDVPGSLTGVVAVAAGWIHSLALKNDGTVVVWGDLFGAGPGTVPTGLSGVAGIAAGGQHCLSVVTSLPVLTSQPQSLTTTAGGSISFSVSAIGPAAQTFQWRKEGTDILGATNTTLSLTNVQITGAGSYDVVVTSASGSTTSTVATLTVLLPPAIERGPSVSVVNALETARLDVAATGTGPLFYQWQKDGVPLNGATNAVLTLNSVATNQAGNYLVVITNVAGATTSSVAALTVSRLVPTIAWPTPGGFTYGTLLGAGQLNASTGVPGSLIYSPVAGTLLSAGSRTLEVTFTPTDPTSYMEAFATVTLAVNPAPLTVTAGNQSREYGQANPALTVGYAGFVNGENAGVLLTPPVLATTATMASLPGNYPITVSGATAANYAITHVNGLLTVFANPPVIAQQPTNMTVIQGQSTNFNVSASGSAPLSFQWFFNATNVLAGATNSTLTVSNAFPTNAGNYTVVVTNVASSATSAVATLTVLVPPEITQAPTNVTANALSDVSFSVLAAGTLPLAYQWLKDGVPLGNATGASLTLNEVTTTGAGNYRVVITNVAGSVTSSVATLTVNRLVPGLTWTNPVDIIFGVPLSSTQLNATSSIPGGFAYTPTNGTILNAGSNQALSVGFTPTDTLNYNPATTSVIINVLKADQTIAFGPLTNRAFSDVPFALSATASSALPVTFSIVSGPATNLGSLVTLTGAGTVIVQASQLGNTNYNAASIVEQSFIVFAPPLITAQPQSLSVVRSNILGSFPASFSITATNATSFQWQFNGTDLAGATGTNFSIPDALRTNSGFYAVVVGGPGGSVRSSNAILRVMAPQRFQPPQPQNNGTIRISFGDHDGGLFFTNDFTSLEVQFKTSVASTNWITFTNTFTTSKGMMFLDASNTLNQPLLLLRAIER